MTPHPNTQDTREQDAMAKITIKELKSEGGMLWIGLDDLSQDVEVVTQESMRAALITARKAGAEAMKERVAASVGKILYIDEDVHDDPEKCCTKCVEFGKHDVQRSENKLARRILSAIEGINVDEDGGATQYVLHPMV